jgi:putative DNA-invertase from lambdoid prophage Rac
MRTPAFSFRRCRFHRDRIKSGVAAAKAHGKRLGRQAGQRQSDRKAAKVMELTRAGAS